MKLILVFLTLIVALLILGSTAALAAGSLPDLKHVPLVFIPNTGQYNPDILFQSQGTGNTVEFTKDSVTITAFQRNSSTGDLAVSDVSLAFDGADPGATVTGQDNLPGTVNFMIGNNPEEWKIKVPTYGAVLYKNLYPGIDLTYKGINGQLKREFTVTPGIDPALIRMKYSNPIKLTKEIDGTLTVETETGTLIESKPVSYQVIDSNKVPVSVEYEIYPDQSVGYIVGEYDSRYPLIIDPVLGYSTYLGDYVDTSSFGVASTVEGNAVVTGYTLASNRSASGCCRYNVTTGTFDDRSIGLYAPKGADIFVTIMNSDGSSPIASTFFGGTSNDYGTSVAVDGNDNVFIAGMTSSTDFPNYGGGIQNSGFQRYNNGGATDAFVVKMNPSLSSIIYSTYLGGSGDDRANGITVDNSGYAYITGATNSYKMSNSMFLKSYPTTTYAYQKDKAGFGGLFDGFITKMDQNGFAPVYSTYLGGSENDESYGITTDIYGDAFVTGYTSSSNFPVLNPIKSFSGGGTDAFVTELSPGGNGLVYSTYLGGNSWDYGRGIKVDTLGQMYLTGYTKSTDFPVMNAIQSSLATVWYYDAFVTKLNSDGNQFMYSTYLGGSDEDEGLGIAIDQTGAAYITGYTKSWDFPRGNSWQYAYDGESDVFLTKYDFSGTQLYSSVIGGSQTDVGNGISYFQNSAVPGDSGVYVTGYTNSCNFPTTPGAFNTTRTCTTDDGFVMKVNSSTPSVQFTVNPTSGDTTTPFMFTAFTGGSPVPTLSWNFGDGSTPGTGNPISHTFSMPGTYTITLTATNVYGSSTSTGTVTVSCPTPATAYVSLNVSGATPNAVTVGYNGTTTATLRWLNPCVGLSGYNITVKANQSGTANITSVSFPSWTYPDPGLRNYTFVGTDTVIIKAIDWNHSNKPGTTSPVDLAYLKVSGYTTIGSSLISIDASGVTSYIDAYTGTRLYITPTDLTFTVDPSHITPVPSGIYVPGGVGPASDLDGDGLLEDVNGNGVCDFADVVLLFQQMPSGSYINVNGYANYFNFSHAAVHSVISFADVVALFGLV